MGDENNEFYSGFCPLNFNNFFYSGLSPYESSSNLFNPNDGENFLNSIENTYKNNDMDNKRQNTSKKLDNAREEKKGNISIPKKKMFKTFVSQKKKRAKKNPDDSKHKWDAPDNIKDRVQINFHNFLIDMANDVANIAFNNKRYQYYFLKLDYNDNIKTLSNNKIKEIKFSEIFNLKISKKNSGIKGKLFNNDINENTYKNIIKKSSLLNEFFDKSYLDLFENYYYKDTREFDFKGKHFILSKNTKTFDNLLEKGNNRSVEYKFQNVIKNKYLNNK